MVRNQDGAVQPPDAEDGAPRGRTSAGRGDQIDRHLLPGRGVQRIGDQPARRQRAGELRRDESRRHGRHDYFLQDSLSRTRE